MRERKPEAGSRCVRTWGAIVVAAGRGTRFGRPKQLLELHGKPMLCWSIATFAAMAEVAEIIVVTEREWLEEVAAAATECAVVPGGATRQASAYEGIKALAHRVEAALVHDGARPMITPDLVRRGMAPVREGHAALLAVPVVDTIKVADETGLVVQTPDRRSLWAAQTPQFAMLGDLRRSHEAGIRDSVEATDDAMLLERAGVKVHIVPGSPDNFKVTLPEDLARAQQTMQARG